MLHVPGTSSTGVEASSLNPDGGVLPSRRRVAKGNGVSDEAGQGGLSIFDNATTGGFHVRSRGYDREQVERYVRKIEDRLNAAIARSEDRGDLLERAEERIAELSSEVTALRSRLSDAEGRLRNAEQPSFAGLGDHVANLLKSAEEQSATLVTTATADAERMRSEAAAAADKVRTEADAYATAARTDADTYSDTTRTDADAYAQATRSAADADAATARDEAATDAARMRQEANQDATSARVAAVEESKAVLAEAQAAALAVRAAADHDADEQREAAATLLHEARQRADHEVGAVTEALAGIKARLAASGVGGVTEADGSDGGANPAGGDASDPDVEDTQLFPATPNSF